MKIGIVGGSLAGCSAAAQLMKQGHEVSVFERSGKTLSGRGGGIGTSDEVTKEIKSEGLIDDDFSYLSAMNMPFIGKHEAHEPFGRTAWTLPIELHVFHWNELWQQLRKNVPDQCYHSGIEIIGAKRLDNDLVELTTSYRAKHQFDLVLFADGYKSFGRSMLFPDKELKYRGYVLWRGLLAESEMNTANPLQGNLPRLSYLGAPGHHVVYLIPNENGSIEEGKRIFNWAAYIVIPEDELDDLMTDKSGKVQNGTLPPGSLAAHNELKLKEYLSKHIPSFYADMVRKTTNSYIQVIYTLDLDRYCKNNMCLIGDAGIVVQPFTGSGIFKGYNNVKDLITCLDQYDKLSDALEEWSRKQVQIGKELLAFGQQTEKAFVWEPMDFAKGGEQEVALWFKNAVTAPKNFNFQRDE